MKINIISSFILLISCYLSWGQVSNQGTPKSWELIKSKTTKTYSKKFLKTLEGFDLKKQLSLDSIRHQDKSKPWRYGYEYMVNFNLENAGAWTELNNGDRIWRIKIHSKGAYSLNFILGKYYMPKDASLYIYNEDHSDLLGAYTDKMNNEQQVLGTWLVQGDTVWLEYYEPKEARNQGKLQINKVIHGYRNLYAFQDNTDDIDAKNFGTSAACNWDVECTIDINFKEHQDKLKHSVGLIIMPNGGACTGTLINNGRNDKAPYFLTANHCLQGTSGFYSNPAQWSFVFNWISPDPVCGNAGRSAEDYNTNTTSGAIIKTFNFQTDALLLYLGNNETSYLDPSWELEWAGWDRSGATPSNTTCIHHPQGDIMKISRDDNRPTRTNEHNFNGRANIDVFQIEDWDIGVTEGGSSGSGLFNQDGRLVGQLVGGNASCSFLDDNGGIDIFGRFDISWNQEGDNTSGGSISEYLDPDDMNIIRMNSYKEYLEAAINQGNETNVVRLNTNPINISESGSTIRFNNLPVDSNFFIYRIFSSSGKLVSIGILRNFADEIIIRNLSPGTYIIDVEDILGNHILEKAQRRLVIL